MMWRWNRHIYAANVAKKSGRSHFANAIRLYGKDAFSHEVLRVCADLEEANAYEAYFINLFRTRDLASGFNLCLGGSHAPHPFRNPWDRPEYREANLASSRERLARATAAAQVADVQNRPDVRAAQSARMKAWAATQPGLQEKTAARYAGKKLPAEHRAKIAANDAAKRPEVRQKLSAKSKAAWARPDFREAASTRAKGQIVSEETRARISAAGRGRKLSAKWRQSISEAMRKLPRRMYCKQGHLLDDDNSYGPRRQCRTCRNECQRARRAKARLTCSRSDSHSEP